MASPVSTLNLVDAYIAQAPEYSRPICRKLREIIRSAGPELEETIRWGGPCYRGRALVCGMGAFKQHVRLFFFRRADLPDPDRLLSAEDGESRVLKISTE